MKQLMPDNIHRQLKAAQEVCQQLASISSSYGHPHKFTLDGRFVGDIGELLVLQNFDVKLHRKQQRCHDATCIIGGREHGVQIKCRRASTVIDFSTQPDLLLVIVIDDAWKHWEVIYNGPGSILTKDSNFTTDEKGKLKNGDKKGRRLQLEELRQLSMKQKTSALRVPARRAPTN